MDLICISWWRKDPGRQAWGPGDHSKADATSLARRWWPLSMEATGDSERSVDFEDELCFAHSQSVNGCVWKQVLHLNPQPWGLFGVVSSSVINKDLVQTVSKRSKKAPSSSCSSRRRLRTVSKPNNLAGFFFVVIMQWSVSQSLLGGKPTKYMFYLKLLFLLL